MVSKKLIGTFSNLGLQNRILLFAFPFYLLILKTPYQVAKNEDDAWISDILRQIAEWYFLKNALIKVFYVILSLIVFS